MYMQYAYLRPIPADKLDDRHLDFREHYLEFLLTRTFRASRLPRLAGNVHRHPYPSKAYVRTPG